MNEVTPWISDYFVNLATAYGSNYHTAPSTEKLKKCQLKRVLTSEPKEYIWVVLSDTRHEVPGRIPKDIVEKCLKDAKRDKRFTRHTGSKIEIRDFTPLFMRAEDGPSTSAPRKVLGLEIRKARLCGAAGESIWGTPQPLDSIPELKEWLHELRKPGGNQDILKIRKKQQDEEKAAKQFAEPSEPSSDLGLPLQPATYAPVAALRKAVSTTPTVGERSPMQRYRRKWRQALPGLDEFVHHLQIPEDARLKILEKQKKAEANPRSLGTVPTNRPPNRRGALEIGSSPARLSSVPRATTPEEWPTSPDILKGLYDDHETEMSSDVDSSRPSSPVNAYHDTEMHEVEPQQELETVPETPQAIVDSQPQHLSPPPPAQPPRPRSPLPSSSNPQLQNATTSPGSIHTSVQAVSGSQLPSLENPPVWARPDDEPSNGPSFELPGSQHDDPPVAAPKLAPGTHPFPENRSTKLASPAEGSALPVATKLPQVNEPEAKKGPCMLAFGESVVQAIELAFQQGDPEGVVSTANDPSSALPVPKVTVAQLPPPKPRSKPLSKVTQKSFPAPTPSPSDRLAEADHSESPARQPLQTLNRKVPVPEVGPTREPVRGRNENGVPTMVLIPASDDTKLSSPLKQSSSSQPIRSSQSIPSSQPIPLSKHLLPLQSDSSSEPQMQRSASQPDKSIAQDGDSITVQVNETVADIEKIQDSTGNTQSSLEYASTQDEGKGAADTEPPKLAAEPVKLAVAMEKAAGETPEPLLPQIAVIREIESQQSVIVENEEVDELENDSEVGGHSPMTKRKHKPASKPPRKATNHPKPNGSTKPTPPSKPPSKPARRADPAVLEKVPSRSPSKLPPKPIVLIERRRTPVVPTDERASTAQKRRLTTPSEEGFPVPQPIKRSRIHEHRRPVQTTLSPIPRTPSPIPKEGRNSVVSSVLRSAKGKERAEGIVGLESINRSGSVEREESELVQVHVKKKVPDAGSKRKPSDAFSAQDCSRDTKRQKVAREPEPRKAAKQLSFVDPDKLRRPPRSKPQVPRTPARRGTTVTEITEPSVVARSDGDARTSKYFNPQLYREPEYPRPTTTPEAGPPQKVARSKEAVHENGCDSGGLQPRIDPRKTSASNSDRPLPVLGRKASHLPDDDEPLGRSVAPTLKDKGLIAPEFNHPPARKLGSFAPDLNPPPLLGLPGGRLMNKQLREILIRTGKVRVREAKAAGSNQNGHR